MRTTRALLGLALALAACSDDETATGGGAGGADGTGGATSGTTATGDTGGGGGNQGPSEIGGPCLTDDDCLEGICLDEASTGNPAGFCSRWCDLSLADVGCAEGTCESVDGFGLVCIPSCDPFAPSCRDAYRCRTSSVAESDWACRPACTSGADCPVTGNCRGTAENDGYCIPPESNCNDLLDSDEDHMADCSDPDCAADPICVGGPGALGAACTSHLDCAIGTFCASEEKTGFPHGACIRQPATGESCEDGEGQFVGAIELKNGSGWIESTICWADCHGPVFECREGYECGGSGCRPDCEANTECASGVCRVGYGVCADPEICNDGIDNDGDGIVGDCYDSDCQAVCLDAFVTGCDAAIPLPASGTGEITLGQQGGECSSPGAALDFYSFTAPANGALTVTVEADMPVIIGGYNDCATGNGNCEDELQFFTGVTVFERSLSGGATYYLSVTTTKELVGPYTISHTFTSN